MANGRWMRILAADPMPKPVEEPSRERLLSDDPLLVEMIGPARVHIWEYINHAQRLGLDTDDRGVFERCVVAGKRAHSEYLEKRAQAPGPPHDPIVYYMAISDLVKIGTTANLQGRCQSIGPDEVLAVEPGSYQLETIRHQQFAHLHARRREWFRNADELTQHIAAIPDRFRRGTGLDMHEWIDQQMRRGTPTRPGT